MTFEGRVGRAARRDATPRHAAEAPSYAVRPPAAHAPRTLMHSRGFLRSPLPMPFVWVGVLLIVLKWFEFGPVATWSWWAILAPLAVAFAWFELIEPLFGFDKRRVDDEFSEMRRLRIERQFPYLRRK